MSAFQSTFDSLRGFPRRLSDAAREVRRTASLAGAAMLAALLYGCWLYKNPVSLWRTVCACLSAVLVINLVLTPLWLNIMYGNAFVISGMRLIKNAVKLPLDTALLYFLLKAVETHRKKAL